MPTGHYIRTKPAHRPPPRPVIIPIGPSIAYVPLTKGQFARISRERAEQLGQWSWYAMFSEDLKSYYAIREIRRNGKRFILSMHSDILGLCGTGKTADHIDHDTLNNCDWNLRPATPTEQNINQKLSAKNKSGVRGVCFATYYQKWMAYIDKGRKRHKTSYHHDFSSAVAARKQMEQEFFGDPC